MFQAESPSSGKFTAIGVYLLTCLFFVVAGFIEFAFVLQLQQYNEKHLRRRKSSKKFEGYRYGNPRSCCNYNSGRNEIEEIYFIKTPVFNVRKIDIIAFCVVGMLFLFFNVIYWGFFLEFTLV